MFPGSARKALTLAELLIAIALIALVIGFLLPSVQRIREMSNRMTCANHLKEMGLAFHRYQDAHGYLPDGGKNQCDEPYHPLLPPDMRGKCESAMGLGELSGETRPYQPDGPVDIRRSEWSWPYQILPFIEQAPLFNIDRDLTIIQTPLKLYHCPTRRPVQLYAGHSTIDYAGCAGSNGVNGIVVQRGLGPISFMNVSDGLSNTVMLGEKRLKRDRFGVAYDDNESWANPGWETEIYRVAATDIDRPTGDRGPSPDIAMTDRTVFVDPNSGLIQFGSSHQKGINVAMGDGAVRFVRFSPNPIAFMRYCVRNDGDQCNPNDF